jgi:hypothetical protein
MFLIFLTEYSWQLTRFNNLTARFLNVTICTAIVTKDRAVFEVVVFTRRALQRLRRLSGRLITQFRQQNH